MIVEYNLLLELLFFTHTKSVVHDLGRDLRLLSLVIFIILTRLVLLITVLSSSSLCILTGVVCAFAVTTSWSEVLISTSSCSSF